MLYSNDIDKRLFSTVQCAFLPKTPRNGYKECSSGRDLGSVCDFACFQGYKLAGYSATTCRRDENDKSKADWDREVPTCERMNIFVRKQIFRRPTTALFKYRYSLVIFAVFINLANSNLVDILNMVIFLIGHTIRGSQSSKSTKPEFGAWCQRWKQWVQWVGMLKTVCRPDSR